MFRPGDIPPPLSPALLGGLALRPVPLPLLQPAFSAVMRRVVRRYPDVFERLASGETAVFLIDPVYLPLVFVLTLGVERPELTLMREAGDQEFTAAVRGPIAALIALLEGRIDGDALFFSRILTIEGDTGAVLALRNAVDGADIDLRRDVLAELGPLAGPANHLAGHLQRLWTRIEQDLEMLAATLLAPVQKRMDQQDARMSRLANQVETQGKQLKRRERVA